MRYFYMPKCISGRLTKNITFHQVSWFLLFPNICFYGEKFQKRLSKIEAIQIEWLYWQLTIQLSKSKKYV